MTTVQGRLARWIEPIVPVLPICALFLLGLALQILAHRKPNYDEHLFLRVADGILATGRPVLAPANVRSFFDHTYLYEYLLAIPTALGDILGHRVLLGRTMTASFGLATIPLVYLVGNQVRAASAGLIAALLVALTPYWLWLSWFIHMEVPMTFFLVLGLYLLTRDRPLAAGIAVAVAVLLKEIALGFWLAASVYLLWRRGPRQAALFVVPPVLAFAGWLALSAAMDAPQLRNVLGRWLQSVGGSSTWDKRFNISLGDWTYTVWYVVIGPLLTGLAAVTAGMLAVRGRLALPAVPPIAWLTAATFALYVAVTYVVKLREDRWVTPAIPMLALTIVLAVDWPDLFRRLDSRRPDPP